MIKQLTVKNWKSFEKATFYVDPLTILIGANASGKSNLLDAAGNTMVPFITVVHRDDSTGASILTPVEEIEQLPKLMAGGSLGRLSSEGRIESALKMEAVA
jgi:predicted ATP-binding protein involved in virulence